MEAKELNDILVRQYRIHDRMKMSFEERSVEFAKKVVSELEKASLEIEREPDIDLDDLPKTLRDSLDEWELDEISPEEEKIIDMVKSILDRVRS